MGHQDIASHELRLELQQDDDEEIDFETLLELVESAKPSGKSTPAPTMFRELSWDFRISVSSKAELSF